MIHLQTLFVSCSSSSLLFLPPPPLLLSLFPPCLFINPLPIQCLRSRNTVLPYITACGRLVSSQFLSQRDWAESYQTSSEELSCIACVLWEANIALAPRTSRPTCSGRPTLANKCAYVCMYMHIYIYM